MGGAVSRGRCLREDDVSQLQCGSTMPNHTERDDAAEQLAAAGERAAKIRRLLDEKRAEKRRRKDARRGAGSGRMPGGQQRKEDRLDAEIARLERGLLPGELAA